MISFPVAAVMLALLVLVTASIAHAAVPSVRQRACAPPNNGFPFCNTSLSFEERTKDLVSRIRMEDKWSLLTARGWPQGNITALPYLGVPGFDWGLNCVHGVQSSCVNGICPTSFPSPPSFGASWNETNVLVMSRFMATEARALWLAGAREPSKWSGQARIGLDCWSPNINLVRDPRWGRNQETPTEDPLRNGQYAAAYTVGMQQGEDNRYLKTVTTLKHWAAYSLDDSDGSTRYNFDAIVSLYDMEDSYFPAFREGVAAGAAGIMCSYNALNGTPTCVSEYLKDRLRHQWGFTGYQTSDTGAIGDVYMPYPAGHNFTDSYHAVCDALVKGETDIDSGPDFIELLEKALAMGLCNISVVDRALYNTFLQRFRLGLFDPVENQPYWNISLSEVGTAAASEHSLFVAEQGLVLLKNDGNVLPINGSSWNNPTIAIIGPSANDSTVLLPNYLGEVCPDGFGSTDCVETVVQAIESTPAEFLPLGDINWLTSPGCDRSGGSDHLIGLALSASKEADIIILVMGLDQTIEAEMHDRINISLPGYQPLLIKLIREANPTAPIILVLINGGVIAIEHELPYVDAVIEAWYPGPRGGRAIADALFGVTNPGGKLPVTMYKSDYVSQIKMSDMSMRGPVGRTYRYFSGTPIFPFGFGLSYSKMSIWVNDRAERAERLPRHAIKIDSPAMLLSFDVHLNNEGPYPGDEVPQVYLQPLALQTPTQTQWPKLQLLTYKRISTQVNELKIWSVDLDASQFCLVGADGKRQVFPGTYAVLVSKDGCVNVVYNRTVVVDTASAASAACKQ